MSEVKTDDEQTSEKKTREIHRTKQEQQHYFYSYYRWVTSGVTTTVHTPSFRHTVCFLSREEKKRYFFGLIYFISDVFSFQVINTYLPFSPHKHTHIYMDS